jgi:hypothetical protein
VLDGRGQARFAQDGGAQLLGGERAGAQDLEHHGRCSEGVIGKVDHAAAACAQLAENLVMFDRLARHNSGPAHNPSVTIHS